MPNGLLLIDIQQDYFPEGRMALEGSEAAAGKAAGLLRFFREKKWPVFHVQHIALQRGAPFFLPGTPGVEIHPGVQPLQGEPLIQKHFPNSFRETQLFSLLRDQHIEKLVVAGMMTHMCVDATVRAATDQGFQCLTVQDACATRRLQLEDREIAAAEVHFAFLAALNGPYGRVLNSDSIIRTLSEKSPA